MSNKTELFDFAERQPDTNRPGGQTWIFNGAETMTIQYSDMWDPALVMHSHENEQINLVMNGKALFRVGDGVYELTKGCIIRIPPNVPHGLEEKIGDEHFQVIQLLSPPNQKAAPESERIVDLGHQGWPKLEK